MLLFLTTIGLLLHSVAGYRSGAPVSACDTMTPNHGVTAQPSNTSSYTISLSKTTYSPNDKITVTISGASFRGFFIQPRPSQDATTTVGNFSSTANTNNPCTSKAALTHDPATDWTSIVLTWNAPATDEGTVIFVYTVVKTKLEYWVKLQSEAVTSTAPKSTAPTGLCFTGGRLGPVTFLMGIFYVTGLINGYF